MMFQAAGVSMFTFSDLLTWSEKLPPWQRDALRRAISGDITDNDVLELVSMAKAARGIPRAGVPSPEPATSAHIRSSGGVKVPVTLSSVRDISFVNALSAGPVVFSPEGLTVMYGENASGKSGIARILKRAAHARNPGGRILPSVFEPDVGKPGSATVDFRVGADSRSYSWVDGIEASNELGEVNVFDASCAAVQVESDNQLAYTPELLRVFEELARACQGVGAVLKAEKDRLDREKSPHFGMLSLRGNTKAARLIANMSPKTLLKEIDAICDVSDNDRTRFADLTRALEEDITGRVALLQAHARRLSQVSQSIEELSDSVSDAVIQEFERTAQEAVEASEAARAARESFSENSFLDGIGTGAWKQLWESARRYSESIAYPAEAFPVSREGAVCLLCQQPISGAAVLRLKAFEKFVRDDVQQRAEQLEREAKNRLSRFRDLRIPSSKTLQRDAAVQDTQVGASLKKFIVFAKLRRRYVLRWKVGIVTQRPIELGVAPDLGAVRARVNDEIIRLRAVANSEERLRLESELSELDDQLKVAPLKTVLKNEVARLQYCDRLEVARADCDTTWITRKAGEVANTLVTSQLRSAFAGNLSHLGFASVPVEMKLGAGSSGQYPYRISLIARENVSPAEILSEGEKTCVAVAGFLAELQTSNNCSAIVLDDPVSSLDHHYRLRVARLLVEAAKQRQVVVFTHDIVFLLMLTKYTRKAAVPLKECSVRRGGARHGIPEDGPPWVAMRVGRRIGVLRAELQTAAAALRRGDRISYEQKAEWVYDRLRQTWERAVEEVLLNEVVVRFGDGVSTQKLNKLTDISDSDVQMVDTEMTYCSSFVHDESGAVNAGLPDPPVIEGDINRLEDWVSNVRERRK